MSEKQLLQNIQRQRRVFVRQISICGKGDDIWFTVRFRATSDKEADRLAQEWKEHKESKFLDELQESLDEDDMPIDTPPPD